MMVWNYIEVGICLILLAFLLWMEAGRSDRSRLTARVAATVLAVAALAGLILPVSYRRSVDVVVSRPPAPVVGPGRAGSGLVAINWQRRLFAGERLRVQGHWQGEGRVPGPRVKLLLMGFGAVSDSSQLKSGDFSLEATPAQTGRAVYRLVALSGTDTVEQEEIPVEVGHGQPLKILILAVTPDFENTFLVNWLAKNGQQVAVRTTVSRNSYQSSFVNMAPRSLEKLTSSLLDGFDIVIADSAVLPVVRRQVEDKGLGLIIRVDSDYLRKRPGMRIFATDSLSHAIVEGSLYGGGRVIYTAMNTTYARMMAGQSASYAAHWSSLLRWVGRQVGEGDGWQLAPDKPRVGEQTTVLLETARAGQPQGLIGSIDEPVSVYLAQDEVLPFKWRGVYWPRQAGWQVVRALEGDTTWAYVWPPRGAAEFEGIGKVGGAAAAVAEIPKYWFYGVFLLSVLFLWVERKIGGMSGKIIQ